MASIKEDKEKQKLANVLLIRFVLLDSTVMIIYLKRNDY
jgi:hypothetical protein